MKRSDKATSPALGEAIKLSCVVFYYAVTNLLLRCLKALLFRKNENPARILIFRTGSLGDSLCAIPTIAAIKNKFPLAHIDILTNPGKSTLASIDQLLSPAVFDSVINYRGLNARQTLALLRKQRYDVVIQLPQVATTFWRLVRDMFFFRLVASAGWGWEVGAVLFYRGVQEKYIEYDNELTRLSKLAFRNGVRVDNQDFPLNITTADVGFVETLFQQKGIGSRETIGVVIGAKRPQNRWPLHYFQEVINNFTPHCDIVLIGGKEDKELAAAVVGNDRLFNLCGVLTPMQSAVALKKCRVVLSNDTGPMHLSYAMGTPTVALFSSRDFKAAWFPAQNDKNVVFRSENIACALCLSEHCANNVCMQAISPSVVSAAMFRLMNKETAAKSPNQLNLK